MEINMERMINRFVITLLCVTLLLGDNATQVMAEEMNAIPVEAIEYESLVLEDIEDEGEVDENTHIDNTDNADDEIVDARTDNEDSQLFEENIFQDEELSSDSEVTLNNETELMEDSVVEDDFQLLSSGFNFDARITELKKVYPSGWKPSEGWDAFCYITSNGGLECQCVAFTDYAWKFIYGSEKDEAWNTYRFYDKNQLQKGDYLYYSAPSAADLSARTAGNYHAAIVLRREGNMLTLLSGNAHGANGNCVQYDSKLSISEITELYTARKPPVSIIENQDPCGDVRTVACKNGMLYVEGWTYDPDDASKSINYHVYANDTCVYQGLADKESLDVDNVYHAGKYHRFEDYIPLSSGSYKIRVYAINNESGNNPFLINHSSGNSTWNVSIDKSGLIPPIPNGKYHIVTYANPQYRLDNPSSGDPKAGDNVGIYTITPNDPGDEFNVKYLGDGYYEISRGQMAMDVNGALQISGTNVQMYSRNGSDAQKWVIKKASDFLTSGAYNIVSKCNGFNLDLFGGVPSNTANVTVNIAHEGENQKWRFLPTGTQTIADGKYNIVSVVDDNYCITRNPNDVNATINLQKMNYSDKQVFEVKYTEGYYEISYGDNALDVMDANKKLGTGIHMFTKNNTNAQRWTIKDCGDGGFNIYSKCNALCVDLSNGDLTKGIVNMYAYNAGTNQKWKFIPYITKYDVAFDGNGSTSGSMESMLSCLHGTQYTLVANSFKKDGYKFVGWNTKKDGSGIFVEDKGTIKDLTYEEKIVLYAQWVESEGLKIEELEENYEYTGAQIKPQINVYDDGSLLKKDIDYTVSYTNNINVASETATKAPKITVKGKGNYTKSIDLPFTIAPKSIGDGNDFGENIVATIADKTFTGKAQKVKPVVKFGKLTLKENKDYTLSYSEDVTGPGSVTVTVAAVEGGNYTGSAKITYEIFEKGKGISNMVVSAIPNQIYTGTEIDLDSLPIEVKETKKSTAPLEKGTDYMLEYAPGSNRVNVGTATVQLKGCSDKCMGTKSVTFKITPKALTQDMFTADDMVYTGTAVKPEVIMTDGGSAVDAANYTVTYSNNTNVASAADKKAPTATIKGKGNYTGTVKVAFDIAPLELAASDLNILLADIKDNKKAITEANIKPTIKYANPVTKKTVILKKGTDYAVEYVRDIVNDNQQADIILKGNYANEEPITVPFRIYDTQTTMNASDFTAEVYDADLIYTGAKLTPQVVVKDTTTVERILTEGKDYTVSYSNNVNSCDINAPGVNVTKLPTVKITGKGLYKGTLTQPFSIQPMAFSESDFDIVIGDIFCNSKKEQTPKVTVTNKATKKALKATDYTVTVGGSTKSVSEAIDIAITGKGNYAGTVNKTFRVYGTDISKMVFDKIENQPYKGNSIRPAGDAVKVYADKKKTVKLKEGIDYVLEYGENIKAGSGSVIVKGIGKYGGSKTVKFTIVPK